MAGRGFPILVIVETDPERALLSSGLIRTLAAEVPNALFTIVAGPDSAPLFAGVPGLEQTILWPDKRWVGLWQQLRHRRWGLLLDLRGTPISRYLSARRRAIRKGARADEHPVTAASRLLKLDEEPAPPFLFLTPEAEARAAARTPRKGPILAVAPGSNWFGKTWPVERFSRIASELLSLEGPMTGGSLMVMGGPDATRAVEDLKRTFPRDRMVDLSDVDLPTAYAALRHARLFLGNEGIMMHLAAAAGAPTLGLFGPSDERVSGPWGLHTRVVRSSRGIEQYRAIDPNLNQHIGHMVDLTLESVRRAAYELLSATEPDHARDL